MKRTGTDGRLGCRGLTIVESVIALFLFGLFIASACRLISVSHETVGKSADHYSAISLGKARIERITQFEFGDIMTGRFSAVYLNEFGQDDPDGRFRLNAVVSNMTDNLKLVAVYIDIKNRITLDFDGESEEIITMYSKPKAP